MVTVRGRKDAVLAVFAMLQTDHRSGSWALFIPRASPRFGTSGCARVGHRFEQVDCRAQVAAGLQPECGYPTNEAPERVELRLRGLRVGEQDIRQQLKQRGSGIHPIETALRPVPDSRDDERGGNA